MDFSPVNILFVDDDEDDYILIHDVLSESQTAHYIVKWVSSYDQAFHIISSGSAAYDVYLIDFFLGNPSKNGLKLLELLRVKAPLSPIIFLTGKGSHQVDLDAMKSGATDYIVKDSNLPSLLERSIRYRLEHTKTLRSLEISLSQYRSLFEQSNDAVLWVALDGHFLRCNQRACDMLGYSQEELMTLMYYDIVDPDVRTDSEQIFKKLLEGVRFEPYERFMWKKSGEIFPTEMSVEGVKDEQGNTLYFQAVVRDISKRKEMEEQRLQLELERKQKESLKQIISGFEHDLRTPLSILNTSLYLIERINNVEKQKDKIHTIRQQTTRLIESIEDVLKISHLEFITSIERASIDLHQVLRELQTQIDTICGERHCEIVFQLDAERHELLGDYSLLLDAFQRLLKNACHYTDESKKIVIRSWCEAWRITIEIKDEGIGISEDDLPHIFDHFYRSSQARMIDSGASGLGLPIVRRTIELHDGSIRAISQEGQGTTIQIVLPLLNQR